MTIQWGDTGKAVFGTLKSFTITPGTQRETLLGTPLTLPTTEPAISQVSFTVQQSDLPTITGNVPMKYNVTIVCSGKIGATASAVSYRVLKNSVSISTAAGASATATQYWTQTHWRFFDVQVGDVLEVKCWASQADVNLDFYGIIAYPSQPIVSKSGTILKDLNFSNVINTPNFTTSNVTIVSTVAFRVYPLASASGFLDFSSVQNIPAIIPLSTYGAFRNTNGDANGGSTQQYVNATQRQMQKIYYPSTISFREILR